MATYQKFNQFTKDLIDKVYNFGSDSFKICLTNTAPVASNSVFGDLTEITAHNGYSAGGTATTITESTSSGTAKVVASDVVFTASGGTIGPFRYVVVYDTTPSSPLKPLIAFADYGSSITLNDGETFTVDFDGSAGLFTIV